LVRDLNGLVRRFPALYEQDFDPAGFEWIDCNDADNSVISFMRSSRDRQDSLVFVCNFTPVPRYGYRVGVPATGYYAELLNTDAESYGGSNLGNLGGVNSDPIPMHGRQHSLLLTLPPLAVLVLHPPARESVETDTAQQQRPTDSTPRNTAPQSEPHKPSDSSLAVGGPAAPALPEEKESRRSRAPAQASASSAMPGAVDTHMHRQTPARSRRKASPARL
jgi:hypothetical protein